MIALTLADLAEVVGARLVLPPDRDAGEVVDGVDTARARRTTSRTPADLARGPARLTLTLPAAERVTARLLDVLGREVATVFDGTASAGETALSVDVSGRAPGVYRLVVAGERGLRLSRSVVVVR